jgi:membrane-associated protease RseP (regulator of RpoE activity)
MSSNINFAGPFIKNIFSTVYGEARSAKNPANAVGLDEIVPSPLRRVNTIIQNQGLVEVVVGLDQYSDVTDGDPGLKLFAGQSISLDNYNGSITIYDAAGTAVIVILESFA